MPTIKLSNLFEAGRLQFTDVVLQLLKRRGRGKKYT